MPPNFEPQRPPIQPAPAQPPAGQPNMPPPMPNPLRQGHSMPFGEQHTVDVNSLPKAASQNMFQSSSPQPNTTDPSYDFIFNSPQQKPKFGGGLRMPSSMLMRVAVGLGGLLGIIILIVIISSALKTPSSFPYMMSVLEDQEEIVHIMSNAASQSDLSSNNQNFVATANLTINSNISSLQAYLTANKYKVDQKALSLKISTATDQDLSNSESSGDYNSTFSQVASAQLNSYMADLKLAYSKTTGPNARALLTNLYNQAKLLQKSLNSTS